MKRRNFFLSFTSALVAVSTELGMGLPEVGVAEETSKRIRDAKMFDGDPPYRPEDFVGLQSLPRFVVYPDGTWVPYRESDYYLKRHSHVPNPNYRDAS